MGFHDITAELNKVASHYHYHRPPAFIDSFREWIGKILRLLRDLLHTLFDRHGTSLDSRSLSGLLQLAVYVAGIAAVAIVIIVLSKRLKGAAITSAQTIGKASHVEEILDATGWRKRAEQLALNHDFRGACRAVYLCLLKDLDEKGVATFAPTKTNYEYMYLLSEQPDLQAGFRKLCDRVETVWFGNRQADDEQYLESLAELTELQAILSGMPVSRKPGAAN